MHSYNQSYSEKIIQRLNSIFNNIMYLLGRYLAKLLQNIPPFFNCIDQFFHGWIDQKSITQKQGIPVLQGVISE